MKKEAVIQPLADPAVIPAWKRSLDLVCIAAASPVWVPLMGLIALAIKILSPGPVLFRQERIGHLGRSFTCLKFRTMKVNAEVDTHQIYLKDLIESKAPMTKLDSKGDTRLFPLAGALRATGLDELPQIFNVLHGEMSLVGPRPCLPYEYENHRAAQKRRFNTLPGLTGLWQVSGKNKTTFDQMVDLDISYLENRSLALDIKIMLKTFPVLALQCKEVLARALTKR